jgi:predicted ribosomally synthesized peptide with SipW-like signal peptide
MKKKFVVILLSVVIVAAGAIGATIAYFSAQDDATNTFTIGNVKIDLTEPNWKSTGSGEAWEAYAGEPLAKDPTVENIGANPCMVRIKVDWPDLPDAGPITYRTQWQTGKLGDWWYDGGDGYFYYMRPLGLSETTDALFDQIVMPTDLENGDASTHYDILVTAQAVQAQGIFPSFGTLTTGDGMDINGDCVLDGNINASEFNTIKVFFEDMF